MFTFGRFTSGCFCLAVLCTAHCLTLVVSRVSFLCRCLTALVLPVLADCLVDLFHLCVSLPFLCLTSRRACSGTFLATVCGDCTVVLCLVEALLWTCIFLRVFCGSSGYFTSVCHMAAVVLPDAHSVPAGGASQEEGRSAPDSPPPPHPLDASRSGEVIPEAPAIMKKPARAPKAKVRDRRRSRAVLEEESSVSIPSPRAHPAGQNSMFGQPDDPLRDRLDEVERGLRTNPPRRPVGLGVPSHDEPPTDPMASRSSRHRHLQERLETVRARSSRLQPSRQQPDVPEVLPVQPSRSTPRQGARPEVLQSLSPAPPAPEIPFEEWLAFQATAALEFPSQRQRDRSRSRRRRRRRRASSSGSSLSPPRPPLVACSATTLLFFKPLTTIPVL